MQPAHLFAIYPASSRPRGTRFTESSVVYKMVMDVKAPELPTGRAASSHVSQCSARIWRALGAQESCDEWLSEALWEDGERARVR